MQIFPPDNPWNTDVSQWPVHPNSAAVVASIGNDKPLRYNTDMAFVLVPPDQKRVEVALFGYPDESDKGPFPIPDNLPIEGWPAKFDYKRKRLRPDGWTGSEAAALPIFPAIIRADELKRGMVNHAMRV